METLLIASFSRLQQDARLRRQIALFADRYRVITLGYGDAVDGAALHLEISPPPGAGPRRRRRFWVEALLLRVRAYSLMYLSDPTVRAARARLRGVTVNKVLANDIDTVPLALRVAPGSAVHADLHEFFPGLHDDNERWVRLRRPYYLWLLRRHVQQVASVTTVGAGVAAAYRTLGIEADVVTNSPRYRDAAPGPVARPIRLVHAGGAMAGRRIEIMMRAVAAASNDVRFTLYLTPNDPAYLRRLESLAVELGPRIVIEPPVAHERLLEVLSGHDVGIHLMPPTVTNQALALPNKFFDFVQARLAIVVGPTEGMARLVDEYDLGVITQGFEQEDLTAAIDSLTESAVAAWKHAADRAATELAAESQLPTWTRAIDALRAAS